MQCGKNIKHNRAMKTKLNFNMWIPTRILFGADELKNLHRQQMRRLQNQLSQLQIHRQQNQPRQLQTHRQQNQLRQRMRLWMMALTAEILLS